MGWITGADVLAAPGAPPGMTAAQAAALADAACDFVEEWCHRKVEMATRHEWVERTGPHTLVIQNPPIQRVYRACSSTEYALKIENTSDANAATVTVGRGVSGELELHLTISGGPADSADDIVLSGHADMAGLLAAVVALGHDWTGEVQNEGEPGSLRPHTYANALTPVYLEAPAGDMSVDMIDRPDGLLYADSGAWAQRDNYIKYDGGWATVPNGLTEVTKQLAVDLYRQALRDSELKSERLDNYAWTAAADAGGLWVKYRSQLKPWALIKVA